MHTTATSFKFLLTGLLASSAMLAGSAQAAVTTWAYGLDSGFSQSVIGGTTVNYAPPGTPSLSWGTNIGNGQSSLVINNPTIAAGSVDTFFGGGTPPQFAPFLGASTSLTHNNVPIQAPSLTEATLRVEVALTPSVPAGPALLPQVAAFDINFLETSNATPCGFPSTSNCDDIFILVNGLLNQQFQFDAMDGDGLLTYFVNIFPVSGGVLNVLPDASCTQVGQASGCIGFQTLENASNTLDFGFTVSTERLVTQVPEPAVLGLLSIGLMGLGVMRKRRA